MRMLVPDLIGLLQAGAQKHGAQKDFFSRGSQICYSCWDVRACARACVLACSVVFVCVFWRESYMNNLGRARFAKAGVAADGAEHLW